MTLRTIALLILIALAAAPAAGAQEFLKPKEALELAFPKCEFERQSLLLTKKQLKRVEKLAGNELRTARVRPYHAVRDGERVGIAWFDTHRVRSKAQTLMIAVDVDGTVRRIEVLRFDEPHEYLASGKWMAQLVGQKLDDKLVVKGEIRNLTGATLTARATVSAVRRVLSVQAVLFPPPEPEPKPEADEQTCEDADCADCKDADDAGRGESGEDGAQPGTRPAAR